MPDVALDATADALVRRALAALPADRPHGRADFARLAPPVAALLHARLDALLAGTTPASPYVDASAAAATEAAAVWRRAASAAAQFPAGEWEEAVREATRLALAHLVRPAATLAAAAANGDGGPVAVAQAVERMRVFRPYPFVPEIVARYAERKALPAFAPDDLAVLVERVLRRVVAPFGADEWADFVQPLFDLAAPAGQPVGTVPTALLRPLLGAGDPRAVEALGDDEAVRLDDLRQRLAAALAAAPSAPAPAPAEAPEPTDDSAKPADAPESASEATAPPAGRPAPEPPLPTLAEAIRPPVIGSRVGSPEEHFDEGPDDSEVLGPARPAEPAADDEPLWKRLARERGEAPEPVAEAAAPADDDEPLWKRLAREHGEAPEPVVPGPTPDAAPASLDALEARVLGPHGRANRDRFTADLFGGDPDAYRDTLARLDDAPTYTAATTVIADDVFRAHRVSPFTDAAVSFTDAVQAQFDGR